MFESGGLQRCPLCAKPIALDSSYKRHLSYCRRAQTRPRQRISSCSACSAAKAKCSFHTRCERCTARGLVCSYERPGVTTETRVFLERTIDSSLSAVTTHTQSVAQLPLVGEELRLSDHSFKRSDLASFESNSSLANFTDLDGVNEIIVPNLDNDTFVSSHSLPCSPSGRQMVRMEDTQVLTRIRANGPVTKQNSMLIIEALCAIPHQMLRRTTLPSFIHGHWNQATLPEPLAVCMRIAQMFASRTPEISPFIWRTILTEQRLVNNKLCTLSKEVLLAVLQASMVYIMMRVVDGVEESSDWNAEMTQMLLECCDRFLDLCGGNFNEDEQLCPSTSWDDWIFAESRRRTSCVWMLMTKTIFIQTKPGCPTNEQPESLPLPAPRQQWEARTDADWMEELLAGSGVLRQLGHLVESKQRCSEKVHAQRLDSWNANTDSLGALLNLAVAML